jgi:probable F420-dependent oxidoreductase
MIMADFGLFYFPTDFALQGVYEPDDRTTGPHAMNIVDVATATEERGFESLFVPEHTHIPTPRRTDWAGGPMLPAEYWHTLDPFVALAAAAAVTSRIRLGTGIAIVPQHDVFNLAKQAASLDWLSGGRAILGIGSGWNAEEMQNHGVAFRDRWKVTRERVGALKRLWTDDCAEFHGEFVDFGPVLAYPKPLQQGGPPILLGVQSRHGFARVVEYADGWMPILVPGVLELDDGLERLRAAAERAGRSYESISLSCYAFSPFGGPPPEDFLRDLIDRGFGRIVFRLPSVEREEGLRLLDDFAGLAGRLQ